MASRILLADDSITIQKVVNLTFADEGIEVVAVSSGDMAERRLAEVSPDLVLADIFMPGKNGYELCEAIKENSQFQHVPVVLLVGAFEPFDQAEANRVKADAHLTKPFESRSLVETVRRLMSTSGLGGNAAAPQMASVPDEAEEAIDALAPAAAPTPLVAPVPNIDFSAMMPENNLEASTLPTRTTGPLGSPAPDISRGAFEVHSAHITEAHEMSGYEAAGEMSQSMTEPIDVFEFSGKENLIVGDSDSLRLEHHEMVNDFEQTDVLEPIEYSNDPVTFKSESNALLDVNISGAGEGESWFSSDTLGNLQVDHQASDNGWQAVSDNPVVTQASTEASMNTVVGAEAVQESSDTACATLLAVDEPLGDVLFDESLSADRLSHLESSSSDSLGFEFTETEVAEMVAPASTHFDLVEAVQEPTQETSFSFVESPAEEVAAAEVPSVAVEEPVAVQEQVAAVQEPVVPVQEAVPGVQEPVAAVEEPVAVVAETAAAPPEQHAAVEPRLQEAAAELKEQRPIQEAHNWQDAVADLDWTTPHAATQSTAELDSPVMPVQTEELQPEAPVVPDPVVTKTADDSGFSAAHMWTEEETRFSPIDIEAVAVEDASESAVHAELAPETGFVVSSVLAGVPSDMVESPVAHEAGEAQSAANASDLSAAAIDQIVRRVLSQLSESVVREVAWEVVPDCVERVIEQLTRESLSKRA